MSVLNFLRSKGNKEKQKVKECPHSCQKFCLITNQECSSLEKENLLCRRIWQLESEIDILGKQIFQEKRKLNLLNVITSLSKEIKTVNEHQVLLGLIRKILRGKEKDDKTFI